MPRCDLFMSVLGHGLCVDESIPGELARHPALRVRGVIVNSDHISEKSDSSLTGRGFTRPRAGFLEVIRQLAEERGLNVQVRRSRLANLGDVHPVIANGERAVDPALPAFLANHDRGRIHHQAAVDPYWLLAQACLAFPQATVAIACPSMETVRRTRSRLAQFGVDMAARSANCYGESVQRIVVGLFGDFANPDVGFEKRDLLLFPSASWALHERAQHLLGNPDSRFRVFGLQGVDQPPSGCDVEYQAGVFGFDEICIPRHGWEVPPVAAWFGDIKYRRVLAQHAEESFRQIVWKNESRNLAIARFVRATSHRLREYACDALVGPESAETPRLVVLTASVDHARRIQKYLAGWPLITSEEPVWALGQSVSANHSLDGRATCLRMVASLRGLERLPPHRGPQFLIWTGSGPSCPAIPQSQREVPQVTAPRIYPLTYMIDFMDRCSPPLRQWSHDRRDRYREADFIPVGVDFATGRVMNYIAQRERAR